MVLSRVIFFVYNRRHQYVRLGTFGTTLVLHNINKVTILYAISLVCCTKKCRKPRHHFSYLYKIVGTISEKNTKPNMLFSNYVHLWVFFSRVVLALVVYFMITWNVDKPYLPKLKIEENSIFTLHEFCLALHYFQLDTAKLFSYIKVCYYKINISAATNLEGSKSIVYLYIITFFVFTMRNFTIVTIVALNILSCM